MSCHRLGDFIKRLYGPRKPTNVPFQILSLDLSQKKLLLAGKLHMQIVIIVINVTASVWVGASPL